MNNQSQNSNGTVRIFFTDDDVKNIKKMNLHQEPLSVENLKTFSGCENYDAKEATEIVKIIRQIALVLFQCTYAEKILSIDNQLDVNVCNNEAKVIQLKPKLKAA
jgi:hypothetical protein